MPADINRSVPNTEISNVEPTLFFRELDKASPTGRFRIRISDDTMYFERADDDAWTTATQIYPYARTGRGSILTVAAADAPAQVKAQADYVCDGTADNIEIQAAMDALTTDRTWREEVKLFGHFYIAAELVVPDYTRLTGAGAMIEAATDSIAAIHCPDGAHSYDVEIDHIHFQGYATYNNRCIYPFHSSPWRYAYRWFIHDCYFEKWVWNCTAIFYHSSIHDNHMVLGAGQGGGIYLPAGKYDRLYSNYISFMGDGASGIYIQDCTEVACYANSLEQPTNTYKAYGITVDDSERIAIFGNNISGAGLAGVDIYSHGGSGSFSIGVVNNTFYLTGLGVDTPDACVSLGIRNDIAVNDILIANNSAYYCHSLVDVGATGKNIANSKIVVKDNTLDVGTVGFRLYGNNYDVTMKDNEFSNLSGSPVIETGTVRFRGNIGYVTENSGTATIANGDTTVKVAHGLAVAPTRVQLTCTGWGNASKASVTSKDSDSDGTKFTITVDADPGASTATFDWRAIVTEGV